MGNLIILPDVDTEQLRNVMGTYYTKFPMSQHTDYSISLPHIEDKLGKDMHILLMNKLP